MLVPVVSSRICFRFILDLFFFKCLSAVCLCFKAFWSDNNPCSDSILTVYTKYKATVTTLKTENARIKNWNREKILLSLHGGLKQQNYNFSRKVENIC